MFTNKVTNKVTVALVTVSSYGNHYSCCNRNRYDNRFPGHFVNKFGKRIGCSVTNIDFEDT